MPQGILLSKEFFCFSVLSGNNFSVCHLLTVLFHRLYRMFLITSSVSITLIVLRLLKFLY